MSTHPDRAAFLPLPQTAILRQRIYAQLIYDCEKLWSLTELSETLKAKHTLVYSAAKGLVAGGFAERHDIPKMRESKHGGQVEYGKPTIKLKSLPFDWNRPIKPCKW